MVEFQCHGSPIVLDRLLKTLIHHGAQLAKPGEFSLRAFLNDKIDLTQAEAIADLIQADSETAASMALRSLQGEFSKRITTITEQMIQLRMLIEAGLDFPEEDIDLLSDHSIQRQLQNIQEALIKLQAEATQGAIMREGLTLVIAGRPNVGKSTLINALAQRDVAIVTPIAGTTRDLMQADILLDDIPIQLIDTAGLRITKDTVEQEGIKRAHQALASAHGVLIMLDCQEDPALKSIIDEVDVLVAPHIPRLIIHNKIDKLRWIAKKEGNQVYLSLKTREGFSLLKAAIKEMVGYQPLEGQILARRRHLDALNRAAKYLSQGIAELSTHRAGELLAEDLRLSHAALAEITGEFSSDDLLGAIFSSFCIGK